MNDLAFQSTTTKPGLTLDKRLHASGVCLTSPPAVVSLQLRFSSRMTRILPREAYVLFSISAEAIKSKLSQLIDRRFATDWQQTTFHLEWKIQLDDSLRLFGSFFKSKDISKFIRSVR